MELGYAGAAGEDAVPPYWCGFLLNVCIPLMLGAVGGWRLCLVLLHFVAPSPAQCLAGDM